MQLEVGSIVEGKVTGITKFGAFVELGGGKTGMVHISEVSTSYVKEISDHLAENQVVKVKILSVSDDGKVSLSIKKCMDSQPQTQGSSAPPPPTPRRPHNRNEARVWQPKRQLPQESMTFEDMMSRFKQTSEDKMSDLKRNTDMRRGSSRRGPAK